ncbi:MAG: zinc ribbon domain-containing protein [Oscillospiraceae bacterium]|nr:zinc ribbon domain-containing protein [Oscillospiraceae bacterium]
MDEIFDKIKDGATKAKDGAAKIAREVAKRTSNAITHTKLAFAVNETQNKIKDVYGEIGKTLYAKYLDGEDFGEEFSDSFDQLDKLMDEVEALNAKIAELKNSLKCPECGAYNPNESDYCSKCGAHLVKEEAATESEAADIEEAFAEAETDDAEDEEVIVINPKKPE